MAKIMMVISEKGFRDEEFAEPYSQFKAAGHEVTVASTGPGEAIGKLGMRVKPDTVIDKADPSAYDAVVVAGGPTTPTYIWGNRQVQKALQETYKKGGVIAAICLAPVVMARASLIKGKRCTVFPTDESISEMKKGGCTLVKDHVVADGKVITADGPAAATEFGKAVLRALQGN